jgi:hypothetical protein
MILDQLDEMEKPEIVGKLLKAAINEDISYMDFLRLSSVVQNGFLPYLKTVVEEEYQPDEVSINEHFASLGIMTMTLKAYKHKSFEDSNTIRPPVIEYWFNEFGLKLFYFGFGAMKETAKNYFDYWKRESRTKLKS